MMIDQMLSVWNLGALIFAITAGLALGALAIGKYAGDPAYASGESTPVEYGLLVAVLAGATGLVFFSFQILATYLDGDPLWPRVVGRLAIWGLYCAAIGVGTTIRLDLVLRRKRVEARENAEREIRGP